MDSSRLLNDDHCNKEKPTAGDKYKSKIMPRMNWKEAISLDEIRISY